MWKKLYVRKEMRLVLVAWLILTLFNLNKAYHIDDTFHLEAAHYLLEHPEKPMSGMINWDQIPTPMFTHNQPPLFFYMLAGVIGLFGDSEIVLHLFMSFFTLAALYFFQRSLEVMQVKQQQVIFICFAACPALVVNQNLMVDVPILALILGVFYYLLRAKSDASWNYYLRAALCLSAALLIKYAVLPVFVVLVLTILLRRHYKQVLVALIPLLVLGLWSGINYLEFGSIHLLDRPTEDFKPDNFWSFVACLGAIATFILSLVAGQFPKKVVNRLLYLLCLLLPLFVGSVYFNLLNESQATTILVVFFSLGGYLLFILLFWNAGKDLLTNFINQLTTDEFLCLLFVVGLGSFIVLFAPFIATRHLLLLIPFVLLYFHAHFDRAKIRINQLSVVLSISLSIVLGISDWVYADYYRKLPARIKPDTKRQIWSAGHWGWQWYANEAGMKTYANNNLHVKAGDYLIFPKDIPHQSVHPDLKLRLHEKKWYKEPLTTFFSGSTFGSMYNSFANKPPWNLSKAPIDTVYIYQFENEIKIQRVVDDMVKQIKADPEWYRGSMERAKERHISIDSMLVLDAKWTLNLLD